MGLYDLTISGLVHYGKGGHVLYAVSSVALMISWQKWTKFQFTMYLLLNKCGVHVYANIVYVTSVSAHMKIELSSQECVDWGCDIQITRLVFGKPANLPYDHGAKYELKVTSVPEKQLSEKCRNKSCIQFTMVLMSQVPYLLTHLHHIWFIVHTM